MFIKGNEELKETDNILNIPIKERNEINYDCHNKVNKHLNKELAISKPNTRVDPRTMMVKIQNTDVTSRTMMRSVRLISSANDTIRFPLSHWGSSFEPVIFRYLSRVCR